MAASYPNGGAVFNISKETTKKEIHRIEGVPEYQQRAQGINLSAGATNAVEFCVGIYGMPEMEDVLKEFEAEIAQEQLASTVNEDNFEFA